MELETFEFEYETIEDLGCINSYTFGRNTEVEFVLKIRSKSTGIKEMLNKIEDHDDLEKLKLIIDWEIKKRKELSCLLNEKK